MIDLQYRQPVDVIIPTYDNLSQLLQCVSSMWQTMQQYPLRFIIVNNGKIPLEPHFKDRPEILIINSPENLGWTGGIAEGLKHSNSEFVLFANDDIFVPVASYAWMNSMLRHLRLRPEIAAVGPTSNLVSGAQNIWRAPVSSAFMSAFLIGFCMLVRRSALDEIGGIDQNMNTGDDIDLSIRFRKAGYSLFVDNLVFIYHHGFQTGEKVYGKPNVDGGWNSRKQIEETNKTLIRKHGFMDWWRLMSGQEFPQTIKWTNTDERDIVLKHVNGSKLEDIIEMGCGGKKTVEGTIGVDIVPKGEVVVCTGDVSVADIVADAEGILPFPDSRFKVLIGRHVLEHCLDTIKTLENWKRILSDEGVMILSLPDERLGKGVTLNPEHLHAFTPESFGRIARAAGLWVEAVDEFYNNISFTVVLSKKMKRSMSSIAISASPEVVCA